MTNNQLTTNQLDKLIDDLDRKYKRAAYGGCHERDSHLALLLSFAVIAAQELQERHKADKPPVHPTVDSEKLDDETLQELIEFRRTTFEYHSKEGNKVQAIIHGITLSALRELQALRHSYLALRGENEDLQSQLYESENRDAVSS